MVETASSIQQQPSFVIIGLARQTARNAVKAELRDRGLKLTNFSARDLSVMADAYFAQHRDRLLAETWERVRNGPALWDLYAKEQRDRQRQLERNLKDLHKQGRPAAQGEVLCKTQAQNGEPK